MFKVLERLINFLRSELDSLNAISLTKKTQNIELNTLPIVLWQYRFLNIKQSDRVFNWLKVS